MEQSVPWSQEHEINTWWVTNHRIAFYIFNMLQVSHVSSNILLHLEVKGIRLGPTLPAFLSENMVKVLVGNFDIKEIDTVENDLKDIMH